MSFNPTYCIAHDDFDGLISGVLIKSTFGCPVEYTTYKTLESIFEGAVENNLKLILVDISVTKELYLKYEKEFAQDTILVIDHHTSTKDDDLVGKKGIYWDDKFSGADLTLKWLMLNHPERRSSYLPYADIAKVARDYDLWEHNDPKSCLWNALLNRKRYSRYESRFMNNPSAMFTKDEMVICRELIAERATVRENIRSNLSVANSIHDGHRLGIVPVTDGVRSFFFEEISELLKDEGLDFVLIIYNNKQCSMRSLSRNILTDRVWMNIFRGHEHAAGMIYSEYTTEDVLKVLENNYK